MERAEVCGKTTAPYALKGGETTGLIVLRHLRLISGIFPKCTFWRLGHPECYPL